jgi:hypothetical protein
MSSQRQDLPDTTLFRGCLSFGRLAGWRLAAYRITSLPFRTGPGQRQMWRTNLIIGMFS